MAKFRSDPQQIDRDLMWHPFTAGADARAFPPLVINKAKGLYLWDTKGNKYFDTISSWWTNLHGHGHPTLVRAIRHQAKKLDHVNFSGFTHQPATELCERLRERLPVNLRRFFYSDNGSTAVEVALKMAFQFFANQGQSQKTAFAYLDGAYHGDTLGAMGVSGVDDFHGIFAPLRFKAFRLPRPVGSQVNGITGNPVEQAYPAEAWSTTESILRTNAPHLAAVIIEPLILCVAGMQVYPAEYIGRLQKLCVELDILVIYDEVATGFGRTGTFFAFDQAGTEPDFLCLAKGLSGGILPLALTITTERVYQAFAGNSSRTFFHGHSFSANPIACASGIASLKIFEKEKTIARGAETRALFHHRLTEFSHNEGIADARFLGMMGALDLIYPKTGERLLAELRVGRQVYQESLKSGLVLRPLGDTIYWFLPLCTRAKELNIILDRSFDVILRVLDALPITMIDGPGKTTGRNV